MENIIIVPENKKQFSAIKKFLEVTNIHFRTEKDDDSLMTRDEFYAKIDGSLEDAKNGKGTAVRTKDELHAYLDSL